MVKNADVTELVARERRLAYQRGYNRGQARMHNYVQRILTIAKGIRAAGGEYGTCTACRYFDRAAGKARWGTCRASTDGDVAWIDDVGAPSWFRPARDNVELNVGEGFGCLHWAPKLRA